MMSASVYDSRKLKGLILGVEAIYADRTYESEEVKNRCDKDASTAALYTNFA